MPASAVRVLALAVAWGGGVGEARAFSLKSDRKVHQVDTGAGLVIQFDRASGGIRSILWDKVELQSPARFSAVNSGFGMDGTTVTPSQQGDIIMIRVDKSELNPSLGGISHYYIFKKGVNTVFMATYASREPSVGELRWITRLKGDLFPAAPEHSDIRGTTKKVESKDVFGFDDGQTRSKYYGNDRAMDLRVSGVAGPGRGVYMVFGNRESSAGGPFFRDIQNQTGSAAEVYNYMNSGHLQTEKLRLGVLFGPYALCFTDGREPEVPDMKFIESLELKGQVKSHERGAVSLQGIKGMDKRHRYTVGFANEKAQYWCRASSRNGAASCEQMKPGTYTMSIYKNELAVLAEQVTVTAGQLLELGRREITDDPSQDDTLWRLGDWDGTPLEFQNGTQFSVMHPSDVRLKSWRMAAPFMVGKSPSRTFPAALWADVNSGQVIKFHLNEEQIKSRTLRVGITVSFAGGRPRVKVNDWQSAIPKARRKIDSRSLTIGSYRGDNSLFTFTVPASAFKAGENTLVLSVISGTKGEGFLSPGYALDGVDLQ